MAKPKFTLHTQRPRRRIRWDGDAAAFLYMVISCGIVLVSLYFAARAFPGFLDVLKHGRPS